MERADEHNEYYFVMPQTRSNELLQAAALHGDLPVVQSLLDAGAATNGANDDGYTPLYRACSNGHVEVAKVLLDRGANLDWVKNNGSTTLDDA